MFLFRQPSSDYSLKYTIDEKPITFEGKGDPEGCLQLLEELIYKPLVPAQCNPKPCGIGTTYQPPIQDTKNFYVIGTFLYSLQTMGVLKEDGRFSLGELKDSAKKFCSTVRNLFVQSNKHVHYTHAHPLENFKPHATH